jgi:hypothetical protein
LSSPFAPFLIKKEAILDLINQKKFTRACEVKKNLHHPWSIQKINNLKNNCSFGCQSCFCKPIFMKFATKISPLLK